MQKLIILLFISLISLDAHGMLRALKYSGSRHTAPTRRYCLKNQGGTTPQNNEFASMIKDTEDLITEMQSHSTWGMQDIELLLNILKKDQEDLKTKQNNYEQARSRNITAIHNLPWWSRWAPNFAGKRTELYEDALVNDMRFRAATDIEHAIACNIDTLQQGLKKTKEETAARDAIIRRSNTRTAELEKQLGLRKNFK